MCALSGMACWIPACFQGLSMTLLFTLGYVGIFVEEIVGLNKAGVALVMAVSLWTIYSNGAAGPVSQAGWLVDAGHASFGCCQFSWLLLSNPEGCLLLECLWRCMRSRKVWHADVHCAVSSSAAVPG